MIVYVVGARPNFVKMAPVIAAVRTRLPEVKHVLVHTGQHYDSEMSDLFLAQLDMPVPDYSLGIGSATHAVQTARVMERIEPILQSERPSLVIVCGDVNSTLAAALAAVKLHLPIAHVESGLRSFDRTMPEEINRVLTDQIADYLFVHSEEAIENLRNEGVPDSRIFFVGNTMIDSLVRMESMFRARKMAEELGLEPHAYLLVTLHRPTLVDDERLFGEVMARLSELAKEMPVVFPLHPRTRRGMREMALHPRVLLLDPLGYLEFLSLQAEACAVLTDSGGVQEETTFLGIPCFTLRDSTERPVTVERGTNTLLGLDTSRIGDIVDMLRAGRPMELTHPPLWDGRAAERIADVVGEVVGLEPS